MKTNLKKKYSQTLPFFSPKQEEIELLLGTIMGTALFSAFFVLLLVLGQQKRSVEKSNKHEFVGIFYLFILALGFQNKKYV